MGMCRSLGGFRQDDTVVQTLRCVHEMPAPVSSDAAPAPGAGAGAALASGIVLAPKRMHGVLEVHVGPDDSHRILPGQRTIVRFQLVG
jgi:hypothetical protein